MAMATTATDLLKPDPVLPEEEEDDLESLRLAALATLNKPKKNFQIKPHPVNKNLVSIVPVPEAEHHHPHNPHNPPVSYTHLRARRDS